MATKKQNKKYSKSRDNGTNRKGSKQGYSKDLDDKGYQKDSARSDKRNSPNDIAWYAANEQILRDAASFNYFNPVGRSFNISSENNKCRVTNVGEPDFYSNVPGVLAVGTVPVPGVCKDGTSPYNMATRASYSFIRHANSGSKVYDSADLGIYYLAVDSAYVWYAFLVRVYGTLLMYDQANTYLPDALLMANGVNANDFKGDMAAFRMYLNQWILKLSTIMVPNTMPAFQRHVWMYSNYFMDDPTLKGQIMMYRPDIIWKFNPTSSETGGCLEPIALDHYYSFASGRLQSPLNFAAIRQISEEIITPLIANEDMGIMGGDILKAYGPSGVVQVSVIPETFMLAPVYNQEVLEQFQHITLAGRNPVCWNIEQGKQIDYNDPFQVIMQENNLIKHYPMGITPHFDTSDPAWDSKWLCAMAQANTADHIVNFNREGIEPKDTMVATRLMNTYDPTLVIDSDNDEEWVGFTLESCGSEYATVADVYFRDSSGVMRKSHLFSVCVVEDTAYAMGSVISRFTDFDYFPRISVWRALENPEQQYWDGIEAALIGVLGNMSNYTIITETALSRMHECALMSEFNVPRIALAN